MKKTVMLFSVLISAGLIIGVFVYLSLPPPVPAGWEMWNYDVGVKAGVRMVSDGSHIIAIGGNSIHLLTRKGDKLWSYNTDSPIFGCSLSSDGAYIAVGTVEVNGKVYLFSKTSNIPLWVFGVGAPQSASQVSISSDGSYIAAEGEDPQGISHIYLFSRSDNVPLWSYRTENLIHIGICISSDGSYVAAGSYDGILYLFSRPGGNLLWTRRVGGPINSVSISADGSYIVVGSLFPDDRVYLFSRENVLLWSYRTGPVIYVEISSDGNYVVARSTGEPRKLWLFSKSDNMPLWTFDGVDHFSISSDGSYIVAGGWDGKIYLFSKSSNKPLWSYPTGGRVRSVAISSDGRYVAAGSEDHRVYFFRKID